MTMPNAERRMQQGRRSRHRLHPAFCISALLLVIAAAGCSRLHAKSTPDEPPLAVPTAPPRDVEPTDAEAPPPLPMPKEPARRAPATRPTPPPPSPKPEAPKTEAPKPEPPKPDTPEPPKPEEAPKSPPTTLQTTPSGAEGELERSIRASLTRATGDLNHIDYRALNADARTQYDTAKRFVHQAEDAIRAKNLVFAKNLADKAAALAAQLAGK